MASIIEEKHDSYLNDLRKKAQFVMKQSKKNKKYMSSSREELIDELNLLQIETEMQAIDLLEKQEEIETTKSQYETLYKIAPLGYLTLDKNGLIIHINDEAANILGFQKNVLIGRALSRYVAPDFQYIYSNHRKNVLEDEQFHLSELKLISKDGPLFYAKLGSKTIIDTSKNEKQILCFIITFDPNELNTSNDKTSTSADPNASKSGLKEMLSSIVQELNHPLGVINNYVQGVIRRIESGKYEITEILNALKRANQQSQRASDIILRMKNFNYKNNIKFENIYIDALIKETLQIIKTETIDYPVEMVYRPGLTPQAQIAVDKNHIQQVLFHLVRNAQEAMRDAATKDPKIAIETNQLDTKTVEICVIDNGPGFDPESMHKMLNLNFTTKSYGVGLGLSVCRQIVEAHGGKFSMELNKSYGACFKFTCLLTEKNSSVGTAGTGTAGKSGARSTSYQ